MGVGKAAKILGVARTTVISWIRNGFAVGGRTPTGQHRILITEVNRLLSLMAGRSTPHVDKGEPVNGGPGSQIGGGNKASTLPVRE